MEIYGEWIAKTRWRKAGGSRKERESRGGRYRGRMEMKGREGEKQKAYMIGQGKELD